jgi:hypothetical protein
VEVNSPVTTTPDTNRQMLRSPKVVMAGLEPATQNRRMNGSAAALYDPWVAGSRFACPAMTIEVVFESEV